MSLTLAPALCNQFIVAKAVVPLNGKRSASVLAQVQLWYSIMVITVMLSVRYVTPGSQRGVVLWLPPLLQMLPAVALLLSPAW